MSITFQEKSIIVTLTTTLIIFSGYFVTAFTMLAQPDVPEASIIALFIGAVVLMVAVQIGVHVIIALFSKHEESDERDKLIKLKATRISYYVLVAGIWATAVSPALWSSTFMILNLLILSFMLSAIIGQISQLVMYRRGV